EEQLGPVGVVDPLVDVGFGALFDPGLAGAAVGDAGRPHLGVGVDGGGGGDRGDGFSGAGELVAEVAEVGGERVTEGEAGGQRPVTVLGADHPLGRLSGPYEVHAGPSGGLSGVTSLRHPMKVSPGFGWQSL